MGYIFINAAGDLNLAGNALVGNGDEFPTVQLGGTTSSHPMWKRSGTQIHARRADDSAFTSVLCSSLTANANVNALDVSCNHVSIFIGDDGNSGAAKTIDWSARAFRAVTMTANCDFTFTAPNELGAANELILRVTQNGTGGWNATWPASVKWAGGVAPTLSTDPGAVDILWFWYDGTNYYGRIESDVS